MRHSLLLALSIVCSLLVIGVAGGLTYFMVRFPDVPPPTDERVEITLDRTIRGGYLAQHVTVCVDCHSNRDFSKYAGPLVDGTEGQGGFRFGPELGLPGVIYARNITPAAIGEWSDGELIRAITSGVRPNGETLFPLMPYKTFSQLCREDLESIVAYLRGLPAIENQVPERELEFPVNLLIRTLPQVAELRASCPKPSDGVAYGQYLVNIAGCADCHTPSVKGEPVPGRSFAGGQAFDLPWGQIRSANLTPDETGLGNWSREQFIDRFKVYELADAIREVPAGDFNTLMPWTFYSGMTREDLGAIYDYLRTVPAVHNPVDRWQEGPIAQK